MKRTNLLMLTASTLAIVACFAQGAGPADAAAAGAPYLGRVYLGDVSGSPLRLVAYSSDVYQIQLALNELGYDAGPADGLMGTRTGNAIRAYQHDQGLLESGVPSAVLLDHITGTLTKVRAERAAQQQQQLQQQQLQQQQQQQQQATSSQSAAEKSLILNIQAGLRRLGYDVPVVSGESDSATTEAIRAYQRDHGLLVDGRASAELLAHIEQAGAAQAATDRENVMAVQQALNARGYSAGVADGVMGNSTRNAIRTYEADAGMAITGRVTPELLDRLGISTSTGATAETGTGTEMPTEEAPATEPTAEPEAVAEGPAYKVVLADDFSDGNYTSAPRWTVQAGQFSVTPEGGLTSEVKTAPKTQEELGGELLKGLVGQALGVRLEQDTQKFAAISSSVPVSNAFRMTVTLSGSGAPGAFSFGPYVGNNVGYGYRIESNESMPRPLRLLTVTENGASVVASANPSVSLQDGAPHNVVVVRDADGAMKVSIDGMVVLETRDQTFNSGFNGVSLINTQGQWTVDDISVEAVQ
jgi:peptidoglycan hydrolase-like protein with peptidoglycan-binding domain